MNDIDEVIEQLLRAEELDILDGVVPEQSIREIESLCEHPLPDDYRRFLRKCGFASWLGHSVYGVYDGLDSRFPKSYNFSAVTHTIRARQTTLADFPNHEEAIVIGKDSMGGLFLLRPFHTDVIWVNRDDEWVITQSYKSFGEFLSCQLQ